MKESNAAPETATRVCCRWCGAELTSDGVCPACLLDRGWMAEEKDATIGLSLPSFRDYEIIGEIARGGMGVVYKARQKSLNRIVAVKMVLAGRLAKQSELHRFRAEAETAARLQHPNIVAIHEVGEFEGQPFFSMDYVEGKSLAEIANNQPLPAKRAAGYLKTIAEAVEYAHSKGVLHRDLKPSNILIDQNDQPRITDFGLAKRLDDSALSTLHSSLTITGQVLGSPNFMPPEQATGDRKAVGPASDVYSLGAILYQLLTGRPPFMAETLTQTLRLVAEAEPISLRLLNPNVPLDLDTICLKCLEKEPAKRYATAGELNEELNRVLQDEPILARPATRFEKAWRWCRRNPALASTAAAAILLLMALAIGSPVAVLRINRARKLAQDNARNEAFQRAQAEQERENNRQRLVRLNVASGTRLLQQGDYLGALPWFVEALNLDHNHPEREEHHRIRIHGVLEQSPKLVHAWFHDGPVTHAEFSPDGTMVVSASDDGTMRVWDINGRRQIAFFQSPSPVNDAVFSKDGRLVAIACADGTVAIWNLAEGKAQATAKHDGAVTSVAFNPDNRWVAAASTDTTARVWDAKTGEPILAPLKHKSSVRGLAVSPDGRWIATIARSEMHVWDAATGALKTSFFNFTYAIGVRFSPDGASVAGAGWGNAWVLNVDSGAPMGPQLRHARAVMSLDYSFDGKRLLTASPDQSARIWDIKTGQQVMSPFNHGQSVRQAAFSPDEKWVITACEDGAARIWDASSRRVLAVFRQAGAVVLASFSPDGTYALTAGNDGMVRLWDLVNTSPSSTAFEHGDSVWQVVFSPDGRWLLTESSDGTARLWDASTGAKAGPALEHGGVVTDAAFDADSTRIATASLDGTARVWDRGTGRPLLPPLGHTGPVHQVMFTPDGKRLITISRTEPTQRQPGGLLDLHGAIAVRTWDAKTGTPLTGPFVLENSILNAGLRLDGLMVATPCSDQAVRVFDAGTGRPVLAITNFSGSARICAYSRDGKKLLVVNARESSAITTAINSPDSLSWGEARVWDGVTGAPLSPPMIHRNGISCAEFSADAAHVLTGSKDGTARVWNATTGAPETASLTHNFWVMRASFSPDGRRVLTGSTDNTACIWDAHTGELLGPPYPHLGSVDVAAFSPDGYHFATAPRQSIIPANVEKTAHLWRLAADPRPLEDLQAIAQLVSGIRIDGAGNVVPLEIGEFRKLWAVAAEKYSKQFGRVAEPSLAWRWQQLNAAAACGNRSLVFQQLEQIGRAETNRTRYYNASGSILARYGRWREAIEQIGQALNAEPANHLLHHLCAPLFVAAGDTDGYRKQCKRMLEQFGGTSNAIIAGLMAKDTLIVPDSGISLKAIDEWATTAITAGNTKSPAYSYFQQDRGWLAYRAGDFRQAEEWLQKAAATKTGPYYLFADTHFLLAMTQFRLGATDNARAELAKGTELLAAQHLELSSGDVGADWNDWIIAQALANEAQGLIDGKSDNLVEFLNPKAARAQVRADTK